MKNVILLYFICLCTAAAQVPQPGIYRVQKPTPFAYDIQRYGDYVYKDKSIAKSYLNEKSQADYAVVAVDKENRSVTFQILSKTKQPAHPSEHDGQLSIEKAFVGHYQSPQDTLVWNQKYYGEDFQGIQQGNGYFFRVYPQCFHLCGTPKIREDSATERTPDRKPTVYRTIQYAVSPFGLQT
ncbi:MAG: hypothetical protein MUD08_06155, partial [Cytophagales bacterium]|nr:hypothetical protein [Cytophagales bacterium]